MMDDMLYDFAVSYASEQREYVKRFVQFLKNKKYHVYYDREEQSKMTGKLLHEELSEIYSKKSKVRVIFLSKEYIRKDFTRFESEIILAENVYEKRKMFIFKFDDVSLSGLNRNIVYSNIHEFPEPEDYAKLLLATINNKSFQKTTNIFLRTEVLIKHILSDFCQKYELVLQELPQLNIRSYKILSGERLIVYLQYEWDAERKVIYFWLYPTEPMDKMNNYNGRIEEIHMSSTKTYIMVQNSGIIDLLTTDIKYETLEQFVQVLMERVKSLSGVT
jgi:hypothetical protein